jgi:membrane fusion protein, multidrug efflux system
MQHFTKLLFATSLVLLTACGGTSKENKVLLEKKAKLDKLKTEQNSLIKEIAALEKEISKLDTTVKIEKPKLVQTAVLTAETFTHYIDLQGKIEANNVNNVTPRGGPGQVKAVFVKKGDNVHKGKLLLKLDDAITKQSLIATQQGMQLTKTQLDFAKTLLQKQENLWKEGIGTEVQLLTARNQVNTLEAQLKVQQEQIKIAQEQVSFSSVYADASGVADEVNIRVGEVFVGQGQIRIVNSNDLKIITQIPESYLGKVGVGNKLKVTLPDLNTSIDATINVAGKLIDQFSRSFYVEATIPANKNFRPNQVAIVRVQDYVANNAITIPINTLQTDDKGKFVMVAIKEATKMVAKKRSVVTGEFYADKIEIKSGLQSGDTIITQGYQGVYDGQSIYQ